jgi:hypothetical protein
MSKEIGMWVDHCRAVIVTLEDHKETVQNIVSNMEKNTRFVSGPHFGATIDEKSATAEKIRDQQNDIHLVKYYAEIAYKIKGADSIMIFGSGEAKTELAAYLKQEKFTGKIAAVESVEKMTDRQISEKVHDFYVHA